MFYTVLLQTEMESWSSHDSIKTEAKNRYLAESCENVRDWEQKIASVDTFSGLDQVLIENIFAIQEDIVPKGLTTYMLIQLITMQYSV